MAAPDFYFAVNATFRWIYENWGEEDLTAYWRTLGREHYAKLTRCFAAGGLQAVYDYWREFFANEPGGEVFVELLDDRVVITVKQCPAISHLRAHGRDIMPLYCRHCTVVSQAMCEGAGIAVEVEGGDGACVQVFTHKESCP